MNGLERIREAARQDKELRFNNLLHHITPALLREAFFALKRDAAPGVDKVTWGQYNVKLEGNLSSLHERIHKGTYRATPSKRIWIPKPDGRQRPIGIAILEDKIVQQAVVWILNQIYEVDFVGFSYGFRPGRSQHNALDALWVGITERKVNWILDADISSFFDTVDHEKLMEFLQHRITDQRVLRLIRKWLRAGISEEGQISKTSLGTPQGAVVSPILANIYLHYALDLWVQNWRKNRAKGDVIMVRYADDFVVGFQHKSEAERFLQELVEQLAGYGLELHRDKTRLIEFGRFAAIDRAKRGEGKPETFDFLGFTHICAKTRRGNRFTIRRKTMAKRLRMRIQKVVGELMQRKHDPVPEQGKWLRSVIGGHVNYYAVPGNKQAIDAYRTEAIRGWLRALRGRSQKARRLTWERFNRIVNRWIPRARIVHPYPSQRLHVNHPK